MTWLVWGTAATIDTCMDGYGDGSCDTGSFDGGSSKSRDGLQ